MSRRAARRGGQPSRRALQTSESVAAAGSGSHAPSIAAATATTQPRFNDRETADVRLKVKNACSGHAIEVYLHKDVVCPQSAFLEARCSAAWAGSGYLTTVEMAASGEGTGVCDPKAYRAVIKAMYNKLALATPLCCFSDALRFLLASAELLFQDGVNLAAEYLAIIPWTAAEEAVIKALAASIPLDEGRLNKLLARCASDRDPLAGCEAVRGVTRALVEAALGRIALSPRHKAATVIAAEAPLMAMLKNIATTGDEALCRGVEYGVFDVVRSVASTLAGQAMQFPGLLFKYGWLLAQVHDLGFGQTLAAMLASQDWLATSIRCPADDETVRTFDVILRSCLRGLATGRLALEDRERLSFLLTWVPTLVFISSRCSTAGLDEVYADTCKVLSTFCIKEQAAAIIDLVERVQIRGTEDRWHNYLELETLLLSFNKAWTKTTGSQR